MKRGLKLFIICSLCYVLGFALGNWSGYRDGYHEGYMEALGYAIEIVEGPEREQ